MPMISRSSVAPLQGVKKGGAPKMPIATLLAGIKKGAIKIKK